MAQNSSAISHTAYLLNQFLEIFASVLIFLSKCFLFGKFVEIAAMAPDIMISNSVHVKYLYYCEKNTPTLEYTSLQIWQCTEL